MIRLQMKKFVSFLMCGVIVFCSTFSSFAENDLTQYEAQDEKISTASSLDVEDKSLYEEEKETDAEDDVIDKKSTESELDDTAIEPEEDELATTDSSGELVTTDRRGESVIATDSEPATTDRRGEHCEPVIATDSEPTTTDRRGEPVIATDSEPATTDRRGEHCEPALATVSDVALLTSTINDDNLPAGFFSDGFIAPATKRVHRANLFGDAVLESSYDSRNITNPNAPSMSIVPAIRNQGNYNTCWAFATVGLFEISARKKGLVTTEEDSNLSEAAMTYFTYGLKDVTSTSDYIDKPGVEGNDYSVINGNTFDMIGGNTVRSTIVASSYMGVIKEDENTKYEKMPDIKTSGLSKEYAFKKNSLALGEAIYINKSEKAEIKKAIKEYGAVSFAYKSVSDSSSFCHKDGEDYYCYTNYVNTKTTNYANHAIIIVGWDDNISKEKFYWTSADGTKNYATHDGGWLCRNSYGTGVFNDGYFWLSYDEGSLDDTFCAIDVMEADTYEYNYHYDTTSHPVAVGYGNIRYANVFKVSSDEDQLLEAVSVALGDSDSVFDIEVYVSDKEMTNPADGKLMLTKKNVTKRFSGIYTIGLDDKEKVILRRGTYYSIILRARSAKEDFSVWTDDYAKGSVDTYNAASLGQSFVGYTKNSKPVWADVNSIDLVKKDGKSYGMNWRLKGLANKATIIVFDGNGADNSMPYQLIYSANVATISTCTLTREGYTFDGWKDAEGNEWSDKAAIRVTESKTLTAKWKKIDTSDEKKSETMSGDASSSSSNTSTRDKNTTSSVATTTSTGATKEKNEKSGQKSGVSIKDVMAAKTKELSPLSEAGPAKVTTYAMSIKEAPAVDATKVSNWIKDDKGNWHLGVIGGDGKASLVANSWAYVDKVSLDEKGNQVVTYDFYFFDANGDMLTGWLIDKNGKRYFLETADGSETGKAIKGWKKIGNAYYFFSSDGVLLTSGTTPDGYQVGADGRWIEETKKEGK